MKPAIPFLLTVNAGFVDTAGFLALQGLFSAHVTGNFATAGAALVFGTSGITAKLLALPVFCAIVVLAEMAGRTLSARKSPRLRPMMGAELALLVAGGATAVHFGPFLDGDATPALIAGMAFVAAMAIQNALQRNVLAAFPPTTLMTGNTTQAMIDLVDLFYPNADDAVRIASRKRLVRMTAGILGFAVGCAAAALIFLFTGMWCFVLPPSLVFACLLLPFES